MKTPHEKKKRLGNDGRKREAILPKFLTFPLNFDWAENALEAAGMVRNDQNVSSPSLLHSKKQGDLVFLLISAGGLATVILQWAA